MTAKQQWLRGAFPYALIMAATLIVWGHTTRFQFVWDDRQFIQELESIRSLKSIPGMFYQLDAQSSYPEGFKLFRPLRTVHYAVNFWLGGKPEPQPWVFHVTNLLWHAGAAMLLFSVSARLFRKLTRELEPVDSPSPLMTPTRWWALWVALAFAVHPIVSEVVCWAKSLDDAMATVFTLASLRALLKWDGRPQTLAAALAWYALAIYSKISAVPFAMMAMAVFIFILHVPWRKALRLSSGFAVVAAIFLVHRHFVIGQSSQTAPISGTHAQTLIDMFPVVPKYLRLLCGAPPFHIDYSYMTGGHAPFSLPVLFGAGTLLLALIVAARALRNRQTLLAGLGLLWIGLFLLPVSNLLPMMQYMAERFLYLPLIGFLWCAVTVLRSLPRARACAIATTATLTIWACVAWNRSWIWQDEVTLFVQSSQTGPKTPRVQENAVAAIFNLPHVRAMFTLDKATRVLRVNGAPAPEQQPAIEETLVQARSIFPEDDVLASALGIFYGSTQRPAKAVPLFQFAAERKPADPLLWANLGQASVEAKDWKQAEDSLNKALALAPRNVNALRSLSRMHWQRGQYQAAAEVLRKLQEIEPANTEYVQWIREAEQRAQ